MSWWGETKDHLQHMPVLAALISVPEGALIKAAEIAIVSLCTALVTMWGVQQRLELQMSYIRTEIEEIRQQMKETNQEVKSHMRDSSGTLNHMQLQILEHRLHEEGRRLRENGHK